MTAGCDGPRERRPARRSEVVRAAVWVLGLAALGVGLVHHYFLQPGDGLPAAYHRLQETPRRSYVVALPEGTSQSSAQKRVLEDFPSDTVLRPLRISPGCALLIVRSPALEAALDEQGSTVIQFSNLHESPEGNVYDPKSVDNVKVIDWPHGAQLPRC